MSVRIETLAELKSIRFDKNETVFCVQNGREYYLELDGGSFTPDDIDFVQAIHSRNAMYIAISGSTAGHSSTIASAHDAESGIENTKPMTSLRTKQAVTAYGELSANKGQPDGYPSLDSSSRIPLAQLPTSVQTLKGSWNASTNTPTLADGTGTSGDTYRVSVAATRNLGSGNISFGVDDRVVYNGTTWEKWDTNDAVTSVHGRTGGVTAQAGDYSAFYADQSKFTAPASVTPVFTGLGTVSGVTAYTWRIGAELHFEITFTSGTTTNTEMRIGLRHNPGSGEVDVTTAANIPTLQICGVGAFNGGQASYVVLAEPSKTYVTFGFSYAGQQAALNKLNGSSIGSGVVGSYKGSVRIQGW